MHLIEVLLDDIEQGRSPLGEFIKGEKLYNDLRDKIAKLQQGIHVAADTTTAVGQALYTDELYRKISEPLRQLDASLAQLQAGQGAGGLLLRDTKQYQDALAQVGDLRRSIVGLHRAEMMTDERAYNGWTQTVAALSRPGGPVQYDPDAHDLGGLRQSGGNGEGTQTTTQGHFGRTQRSICE